MSCFVFSPLELFQRLGEENFLKNASLILLMFSICLYSMTCHAGSDPKSAPWVGVAFSGEPCQKSGGQGFGPFDYTDPSARQKHLPIVEEYHFTKEVEMLVKGSTGYLPDDLNYTLNSFPNHHKALMAVENYQLFNGLEIKKGTMPELRAPVECYFQRAINFSPNDFVVIGLYGYFLKKTNHAGQAEAFFQKVIKLKPNDLGLKYVYGLFLFDSKKYQEALMQAQDIYKKNYPKQRLKKKLIASGHWKE